MKIRIFPILSIETLGNSHSEFAHSEFLILMTSYHLINRMVFPVDLILVPTGPEYKAVCTGLRSSLSPPPVVAIPIGIKSVTNFLKQQQFLAQRVLVMGLAGSLSPQYGVGEVVIYQTCSYIDNQLQLITKNCDHQIINLGAEKLRIKPVKGLTSDKLVYSALEKQKLAQNYPVDVVDMEGIAIVNHFKSVAIIRVISDNHNHNLPDLNFAINAQGKLTAFKMALAFLRQPLAAMKLIKGSLTALKILEKVTSQINF